MIRDLARNDAIGRRCVSAIVGDHVVETVLEGFWLTRRQEAYDQACPWGDRTPA